MSEPSREENPVTQADVEFAMGLFHKGQSSDEICQQLVARGVPEENAAILIRDILIQSVYAEAVGWLNEGISPEEVKQKLIDRGFAPEIAAAIVNDVLAHSPAGARPSDPGKVIVLKVVGGIVFVIGAGLFIGNITGLFRTFPLAGYLTMVIGGAIFGAGQKAG